MEKKNEWQMRVFDSLSYPTRMLTPNGTIIAINNRYRDEIGDESIIGKRCEDANSATSADLNYPCSCGEVCPLEQVVADRRGQSIVFSTVDKEGKDKWEEHVFSPILNGDGSVGHIIESIRDVTRYKKLEKMYSGMRVLIDNVVQSSVSGIMAADRKGNIILMNKAAEDLFDYTAEEANAVNIEDFYPDGVARQIMRKLRDSHIGEKGKLPITKVNILTRHREEIPVEMTAAIIYEDEKEYATAAIFNDLREKLAVEQKLKEAQNQVMQTEKMASLGRLAAGVAHEINNPLTSILLYGNIMREKLEEESPLKPNLAYILEDAERCKDIVKNLLAYSRQTNPKKDIFLLNSLVDESMSLIRDQKLFMHVEVIRDFATYPIYINADKTQLGQVVINLIINALDAMGGSGRLTFSTSGEPRSGRAYLDVGDSGTGIPQENLSRIFDPFFTTKAPGQGTGLGLSMAYGILEENRGRISIKETGPGGTTIRLQLPAMANSGGVVFDSIG